MVKATGYSEHILRRDVAEVSSSVAAFISPPNTTKLIVLDNFDTEVPQRFVHTFYREKFPTLDSVLVA